METKKEWVTLSIRFTPADYERLREESYRTRTPVSELVRRAVRQYQALTAPKRESVPSAHS